jgi:Gram-negative bacterial TonB protein C-terminal
MLGTWNLKKFPVSNESMKKFIPLFIILFVVLSGGALGQSSVQTNSRRDCSFIARPIKDISGGVVNGKAFKISTPRLNETAKRFAQNTVVSVKIEIDENGKVIFAQAGNGNPLLQKLSEQAARKTSFSPTMVSGQAVKINGQIFYKFDQGKAAFSYRLEPVKYEPPPIPYDFLNRLKMFDSEIVSAIYDFRAKKSLASYAFIKNGRAAIQLCMSTKTPEILEKIKETGFELSEETNGNGLAGQIAVGNLEKLADIEEIRFITPEMP